MEFLFRAFGPPDATAAPQTTEGAADASAGVAGGGAMGMIIWIVILFAMFYFLIIMPQRKKDKEFKSMMGKLKVGDKIVTIGGIIGKVTSMEETTLEIKTGDTKMEISRKSISAILGKSNKDPNKAIER
jgi:preprotein translocase subunit YajC